MKIPFPGILLFATAFVSTQAYPQAQPPAPKPTYGTWGVDLSGMDKSVKPGDDFFDYVNGTWYKNALIPPDRLGIGSSLDTRIRDGSTPARVRRIFAAVPE